MSKTERGKESETLSNTMRIHRKEVMRPISIRHHAYLEVSGLKPTPVGFELEKEIPEVDTFLGTAELPMILQAIDGSLPERSYVGSKPGSYVLSAADPRVNTVRGGTAYVKVSEGCNRSCSFCIRRDSSSSR